MTAARCVACSELLEADDKYVCRQCSRDERFASVSPDAVLTLRSVYVDIGDGTEEWIGVGCDGEPLTALPRPVFLAALRDARP